MWEVSIEWDIVRVGVVDGFVILRERKRRRWFEIGKEEGESLWDRIGGVCDVGWLEWGIGVVWSVVV